MPNEDNDDNSRPTPPASTQYQEEPLLPTRDRRIRFSAPYLPGSFPSSDTLRGFHIGSRVPQRRFPVPPSAPAQGAGSGSSSTTVVQGASTSTTNNVLLSAKTTTLVTPSIPAGSLYQTAMTSLGTSYQLLAITSSGAARIQVYNTNAAQASDASRPITQGPGFGTEQGIVTDINLDTSPYIWACTPPVFGGAQGATQTFVSVTNNSSAASVFTISLAYVSLVA